jgi:hypothetical protein
MTPDRVTADIAPVYRTTFQSIDPHRRHVAFARMRRMIDAMQGLAEQLALHGAAGPLLAYDRQQTHEADGHLSNRVNRWEIHSVGASNDRVLAREVLSRITSAAVANDVTAVVILMTRLHSVAPVSVRASCLATCLATRQVFASESILTEGAPADWQPSTQQANQIEGMAVIQSLITYMDASRRNSEASLTR